MTKPIKEYVFRPIDGQWKDVAGSGEILADVLTHFDILIDDRAQFVRLIDYERGCSFWYRAYNQAKITLTIWELGK